MERGCIDTVAMTIKMVGKMIPVCKSSTWKTEEDQAKPAMNSETQLIPREHLIAVRRVGLIQALPDSLTKSVRASPFHGGWQRCLDRGSIYIYI